MSAIVDHEEIHLTLRALLEAVAELPAWKSWENLDLDEAPPIDEMHLEESFSPEPSFLIDGPEDHGTLETTGDYVIDIFGVTNQGDAPIRAVARGVLGVFPHAFATLLPSGAALRIPSGLETPGPHAGQIVPTGKNKSRCRITVPWVVHSINSITT